MADKASLEASLQEKENAISALQTTLSESTAWQAKAPAVVALGTSLARFSDFKATAANAAISTRVLPATETVPQDLEPLKGIGTIFEQRLYDAGVGTYWEVAHLSDDEFKQILRLTEMQLLHISFDDIRADAVRLAQETNTVGLIWEGVAPDDFAPIKGIGKTFEQRLYDAGIRTYAALADATPEQLAEICQARKPIVPDYASWIEQAKALLAGQSEQ